MVHLRLSIFGSLLVASPQDGLAAPLYMMRASGRIQHAKGQWRGRKACRRLRVLHITDASAHLQEQVNKVFPEEMALFSLHAARSSVCRHSSFLLAALTSFEDR